ncbi:MAG: hypothetical protein MN733_41225 [Nitrososphaera sp.]|nr:hypothetical protein [Nitrososphaera sp.]
MTLEQQAASLSHEEIVSLLVANQDLVRLTKKLEEESQTSAARIADLAYQVAWFQRQLFGRKSGFLSRNCVSGTTMYLGYEQVQRKGYPFLCTVGPGKECHLWTSKRRASCSWLV